MRKVVVLAPASVIHTRRWVEGLHSRGVSILLATQHPEPKWIPPQGVRVVVLPHRGMAGYFLNVRALRRLLRSEQPDLLNAHYASGYGTLAALAGHRPWLLSVWGSDVYDFPNESRFKGWLLRRNLRRADALASTSQAMARQVQSLVPEAGPISITPFGVDTERFSPEPARHEGVVIGTVKTLAPKYGIDILIRAFAQVVGDAAAVDSLTLVIVGGGEQRAELEALAASLGVRSRVQFIGPVAHAEVPRWLNSFDIYVAASRLDSESFGVAVIEASACGLPVVVSDTDGLSEVVVDGVTGCIVPRDDVPALAEALRALVRAPALRRQFGEAGRLHVSTRYEWQHCVDLMLQCFEHSITRHQARISPSARP